MRPWTSLPAVCHQGESAQLHRRRESFARSRRVLPTRILRPCSLLVADSSNASDTSNPNAMIPTVKPNATSSNLASAPFATRDIPFQFVKPSRRLSTAPFTPPQVLPPPLLRPLSSTPTPPSTPPFLRPSRAPRPRWTRTDLAATSLKTSATRLGSVPVRRRSFASSRSRSPGARRSPLLLRRHARCIPPDSPPYLSSPPLYYCSLLSTLSTLS